MHKQFNQCLKLIVLVRSLIGSPNDTEILVLRNIINADEFLCFAPEVTDAAMSGCLQETSFLSNNFQSSGISRHPSRYGA
jgi:hypothetical protein